MNNPPLLVSACLLGRPCRYNGSSVPFALESYLKENYTLIPVCPEQLGGLPTPRAPSEINAGRVLSLDGDDVTSAFMEGASKALALAKKEGCKHALLMERSPSCGYGLIYDGSFTGTLVTGNGIFASLLEAEGIAISTPSHLASLLA